MKQKWRICINIPPDFISEIYGCDFYMEPLNDAAFDFLSEAMDNFYTDNI